MGKKGKWFSAVRRVFSSSDPEGREAKTEKVDKPKSKKKWPFGRSKHFDPPISTVSEIAPVAPSPLPLPLPPTQPPQPQSEEIKDIKPIETESEQNKHAYSVALASAVAAEAAAVAAQAAAEVVRLTAVPTATPKTNSRSKEELAAVKIQTAFRGYLMDEDWDHSHQSKEQIEASLMMKQEAALRRERGLAYAFSHQWKNSGRTVTPTFTDQGNPNWGWSWMERWMSARPCENQVVSNKDPKDSALTKNPNTNAVRTFVPRALSIQRPATPSKSSRPPSRQSPSTPPSKDPWSAGKFRPSSPRDSWLYRDDDLRSITSIRSERPRRLSTGGASVQDDSSLTSTPALPSYMQSTKSARAKSRYHMVFADKFEVPERASLVQSSIKKRLSFPVADKPNVASAADKLMERARRHSEPPKVDPASLKDVHVP